ncbi:AAA family ATPase [Lacrimispora sp.]|uniref:cytidylate kinase-like family protein n=1 Tax=Lacrimispora sp. TaxID=2719234 RepID=UPI003994E7CA
MENFIITIARGFGSGGREIASRLAAELKIQSYENRILTLASQLSGYDEHFFKEADEKLNGSLLAARLAGLPKLFSPRPNMSAFVSNERLFEYQKQIILELANSQSCIIVGKCADYILKERKNVVSVYIEAPRDYCIARVVERMNISPEEAEQMIVKTDKYRADYYKYYTGGNYWTNPVNYDVTLNSERLGDDGCMEVIKKCLKLKMGEKWSENYEWT